MPDAVPLSHDAKLLAYQVREYRRLAEQARKDNLPYATEYCELRVAQLEQLQTGDESPSPARRSGPVIVGGSRG